MLDKLPKEILATVASFLKTKEVTKLVQTNKQIKQMVYESPVPHCQQNLTYQKLLNEFKKYEEKCKKYKNDLPKKSHQIREYYENVKNIFINVFISVDVAVTLGVAIGTGMFFHKIYNSYFVAIENAVISAVPTFLLTTYYPVGSAISYLNETVDTRLNRKLESNRAEIKQLKHEVKESQVLFKL